MDKIILPNGMEVLVASYGGVGTTFLISYLSQYKITNDPYDLDGFKHSPLPPMSFNPNLKYIYIYGDPRLATVSLFRRNYHYLSSVKYQKWGQGKKDYIPNEQTLEEYLSKGVDKLHFKKHFFNWYDKYLPTQPVMFIKYESLFDNVDKLIDFLELPKASIDNFPAPKKRNSSLEELPPYTLEQLNNMYGTFSEELKTLKDVEIRKNASNNFKALNYLMGPYFKPALTQFRQQSRAFLEHKISIFSQLFNK